MPPNALPPKNVCEGFTSKKRSLDIWVIICLSVDSDVTSGKLWLWNHKNNSWNIEKNKIIKESFSVVEMSQSRSSGACSKRQAFQIPHLQRSFAKRSRAAALLEGHVGPAEAASGQQHVPDQRLDGGFPHQPDEEELLDDRRRDGAERRQAKQELPEPVRLVGVLTPHIFLQSALGFLLQTLHVGHVRQSTGIYARRQGADRTSAMWWKVTAGRLTSRLSVLISINLQDSQSLFCHKQIGSSSGHQRLYIQCSTASTIIPDWGR